MKEKYRELCIQEDSIPLFSQGWWLDAVAGEDNWDVILAEKGGKVQASLPYIISKRYGFSIVTQPVLTQTLGPWIRKHNTKYAKELGRQKDLMEGLINQLPEYHRFNQNWHHSITNWLPFYWKGFNQSTRYTYILNNINDEEKLWGGLQQNIRTDIRKATKLVQIRDDLGINEFLALNRQVFDRQGMQLPYSEDVVRNINKVCTERGCCKIYIAEDEDGKHHAGVYIIWDNKSAYYLLGGGNPDLRGSGATSLCMWEAIKFSAQVTDRFDFEGSMIEGVERFVRGFGATQTPYSSVSKTPSRLFKTLLFLKDLRNP